MSELKKCVILNKIVSKFVAKLLKYRYYLRTYLKCFGFDYSYASLINYYFITKYFVNRVEEDAILVEQGGIGLEFEVMKCFVASCLFSRKQGRQHPLQRS